MELDQAVRALYALPPEEFTAARDAAAKAAPDRDARDALRALRRPTVPAWLVNLLVHEEPTLLDQLLALGPALADAQSGGRADELRTLGHQRRQLVAAVTERAAELARRPVAPGARSEVESTLEAALADPASADAVRSGQLMRALSYAGFGGADLDDAVAGPAPVAARSSRRAAGEPVTEPQPGGQQAGGDAEVDDGAPAVGVEQATPHAQATADAKAAARTRAAAYAQAVAAAEATALAAAGRLDDAVRASEAATGSEARATATQSKAEADVEDRKAALAQARQARKAARREAHEATEAARYAVEVVRAAQAEEANARESVDALRRGPE